MKLVCTRGTHKAQEWEVEDNIVSVGRDPLCTIVIEDPKASRIHCEIRRMDSEHILVDRNSTNGTYVNGLKVGRHTLSTGDVVTVGSTEFRVVATTHLDEVRWEDDKDPSITLTIPVESMVSQLQEAQLPDEEILTIRPVVAPVRKDGTSTLIRTKLLSHLQIVYELGQTLGRLMSVEEIYNHLSETLFRVFSDIERFCIVLQQEDGDFKAVTVRSRTPQKVDDFPLSNAIFQQAIQGKMAVRADDAQHDARFQDGQSIASLHIRSVMCSPLIVKSEAVGAVYVDNRTRINCFGQEDLELLTSISSQAGNAIQNARLYKNLQNAYQQLIISLITAIEAKDPYTYGHHKRVTEYAMGIAQEMPISPATLDRIHRAAELHDIGKIGVHEQLIHKPGSLTDSEVLLFQTHVLTGEKILNPVDYLRDIVPVVRQHHEHYDGKGYPDGLSGEQILIEARVLAAADSFDAMTTQRTYNHPVSFAGALQRCRDKAGTQFDPQVVEALAAYLNRHHYEKMVESASESPVAVT